MLFLDIAFMSLLLIKKYLRGFVYEGKCSIFIRQYFLEPLFSIFDHSCILDGLKIVVSIYMDIGSLLRNTTITFCITIWVFLQIYLEYVSVLLLDGVVPHAIPWLICVATQRHLLPNTFEMKILRNIKLSEYGVGQLIRAYIVVSINQT